MGMWEQFESSSGLQVPDDFKRALAGGARSDGSFEVYTEKEICSLAIHPALLASGSEIQTPANQYLPNPLRQLA